MGAWVYILQCRDRSYYVGSTTRSPEIRVCEHNDGIGSGYTRRRRPVELCWSEYFETMLDAFFLERRLKRWSRAKKRSLHGRRHRPPQSPRPPPHQTDNAPAYRHAPTPVILNHTAPTSFRYPTLRHPEPGRLAARVEGPAVRTEASPSTHAHSACGAMHAAQDDGIGCGRVENTNSTQAGLVGTRLHRTNNAPAAPADPTHRI